MAGVYAYHEFTDFYGTDHKIEIYDTTYSGSTTTFRTADGNGYKLKVQEGLEDKLKFSPLFRTSVEVNVLIDQDVDGQMDLLVDDIALAQEGQFWCRIYRDYGSGYELFWLGSLVPDQSNVEDLPIKALKLQFTDGLARLKDFPFAWMSSDIFAYKTDLEILIEALSYTNVSQFFGSSDTYITSNINWYEIDQRKTRGALMDTRSVKYNYLDDVETLKPKNVGEVISDILKTYGANIRFDAGKWMITQPEAPLNTIDYHNYSKSGTWLSKSSAVNDGYAITDENPNATIIDSWKPLLKNVDVNIPAVSLYKAIFPTAYQYIYDVQETFPTGFLSAGGANGGGEICIDYDFLYTIGDFNTWTNNTIFINFTVETADYALYSVVVNGVTRYELRPKDYIQVLQANGQKGYKIWRGGTQTVQISGSNSNSQIRLQNAIVIYPFIGADATEITVRFDIRHKGLPSYEYDGTYTGSFTIYQQADYFGNWTNKKNIDYQTTVATLVDASEEILEDVQRGDVDFGFVPQGLQIYNGTSWQVSAEWNVGTSAVSGYPVTQLLTQEALYLQRRPRQIIDGSFTVQDYYSYKYLDWRSGKWIFLTGEYNANTCVWQGQWMELIRQTTSTNTQSTNPYRGRMMNIDRDVTELRERFNALNGTVTGIGQTLQDMQDQLLQMQNLWAKGVQGVLTNDIDGLDSASTGTKRTIKVIADGKEWKLIAE